MAFDVKTLSISIPDPGGDNKQLFVLQAPTDAHGGGLRILEASASNGATMNAGTSFSLALHKYSSAGTPAVNGTIAAAIGGTAATYWTIKIPQDFTIDDDYAFLDAGEWLVVDYQEDGSGNPTACFLTLSYLVGK